MKFVEKMFYNIRHVIPTIGMAGLTMMPVACAKVDLREDPEPEVEISEEPIDSTKLHDVELTFSDWHREHLAIDTLQKYIDDKMVKTIYLVPTGHWGGNEAASINAKRKNFFQPRMEMSEKLRGRGDFDFKLGEASKVPNDSLWFVQQGWTINKAHQK